MNISKVKKMNFSSSAVYQISIMGELDKSWSSRLASMQISLEAQLDNKNIYTLVGRLKDQAELSGILNTLYDLHLILLEIKVL